MHVVWVKSAPPTAPPTHTHTPPLEWESPLSLGQSWLQRIYSHLFCPALSRPANQDSAPSVSIGIMFDCQLYQVPSAQTLPSKTCWLAAHALGIFFFLCYQVTIKAVTIKAMAFVVTGTQCLIFLSFLSYPIKIKIWECSVLHCFNTSSEIFYTCCTSSWGCSGPSPLDLY